MLKRKFRSIAALTSAVLFINAGICTFAATAAETILPAVENETVKGDETEKSFNEDIGYALFVDSPDKTVYKIGEELDLTGATFDSYCPGQGISGNNFNCDLNEYIENGTLTLDASEFDNTKPGKYTIHVNYETATDSFDVTVIDEETDLPDELTLHCYPYRLDFDLNMELDLSGAIISGSYGEKGENYEFRGEYLTDMIEKGIVEVDVSEYNSSEIGTYTIYVKLGTAVQSFDVRVGCPLVQNILEIKALPDKTVYNYGEELDLTGAEIYGWERGDGGRIPDAEFTEDLQTLIDNETIKIDYSEFYATESGTCTIYLNYGHAWASFEVTVKGEEKQEYYSLYIDKLPTKTVYKIGEELDITGTKIYGSYTDGELVGDIFPTDLARYLENGMMTLDDSEFDNTKAGTYTIYVHYGAATASFEVTVTDESVIEENAVMTVEITEIGGDTLFVRQSGNSGDLMTLSAKYLDSNIQPTVGMKLEVTYSGGILTTYPAQFGNIKKVSAISDYTSVAGDTNGDGDFTIADMVIMQKHIMGKKTAILSDWKAADLYEDGKIDVYDFILMRKEIVKK